MCYIYKKIDFTVTYIIVHNNDKQNDIFVLQ